MWRLLGAVLACTFALPALAEREARIGLPNRGALLLVVPDGWRERIDRPDPAVPPRIAVVPDDGSAFRILLMPAWPKAANDRLPDLDAMKEMMQAGADAARPAAVEGELPVQEVKGTQAVGAYFSATARAPAMGAHKRLTHGIVRIGTIVVAFRIHDNGDPKVLEAALRLVRQMRHA